MRLQHAARRPVLLSDQHFTFVKGICKKCLSVYQAAVHLVNLTLPVLVQTSSRETQVMSCSSFPPVSPEWSRLLKRLTFIIFFSFRWFFKIMRRREGLIKESGGCDYQTLRVSPVYHWAFSFSFRTTVEASLRRPPSWFVLQGSNAKLRERGESCQPLKATSRSSCSPSAVH